MNASRTSLFLSAAALLAGCAAEYGYSQLDGRRYYRTPIDTYPVQVVEVDGKSVLDNPVPVAPGRHVVGVQAPPGAGRRLGEVRSIELDVQACTRYYLVAVKPTPLASDFSIRIDHREPVAGCTAPKS